MLRVNIPYQQGGKGSAGGDVDEMVAQEAMQLGNEAEGNSLPPTNPFGMEPGGEQTASVYSRFVEGIKKGARAVDTVVGRASGGITDPRTQDAVARAREIKDENVLDSETADMVSESLGPSAESPPALGEGEAEATPLVEGGVEPVNIDPRDVQQRYEDTDVADLEKRTDMRNLNIERHMEESETSDDIAAIFDAVAESIGDEHVVRKNKTLEEMTPDEVREEMKAYIGKDSKYLASDRQLYAARAVIVSMGGDVVELANKIKAGDATPEVLLTYQKKVKAMAALQQHLRGNVRAVAQALQQQSVIAQTLKRGSLGDIDELMNVAHMTPQQIQMHAATVSARVEREGGDTLAALTPDFWQRSNDRIALAVEYWKANLLSGAETHLVNVGGNAIYNVWENAIIRPTAAAIGKGLQKTKWGSDTDRVHIGESMGAIVSSYAGLRDGFTMFTKMVLKDESLFLTQGKGESQGLMKQAADRVQNPVLGPAARGAAWVEGLPFKFLQAEDDLFKTLAYRQELTALTLRQAYNEGLTGKAAYTRATALIKEPSNELHEASLMYAKNLTYTNTESPGFLGLMGQNIKTAVAHYPILGHITPFINTPVNLMQRGWDMSVLAAASPQLWKQVQKGGAERDVAFAKMGSGVVATGLVYHYFTNGMITGNGPDNPNQRRVLEKTGWKPNSIRTPDGKYHPYKRLEPFATSISGLVDTLEAAQYANTEEDASTYMSAAVFGVANHMMDGTFMRGLNDAFALMDGRKTPASYFAGVATGYVPLSSAQRTAAKLVDPQLRRTSDDKEFQTGFVRNLQQRLKKSTPGMSPQLRPARHWDASLNMPDQGRVAYALSPVKSSEDKGATASDKALIESGVSVGEPSPMVSIGTGANAIHFSLIDLDKGDGMVYDQYFVRVGDRRKEFIQGLIASDDFKEMTPGPGGSRHLALRKALHDAEVQGREDFFEEDMMRMYANDPEQFNSIAQMVSLDREAFYDRITEMIGASKARGGLPQEMEEQLEHVRKGAGKKEQALPMPTQKVKPEKPFEVGF